MAPLRTVLTMGLVALLPAALRAQVAVTPGDRASLGVTVYSGFGLVRDARRVPPGASEIVWTGVPRTVDAGTALLRSDDRAADATSMTVEFEQGRSGVYEVGRPVVLVSPEGARIEAVVASTFGPVFRSGDRLIADWKGYVEVPDSAGGIDPATRIRWRLGTPSGGEVWTASYLVGGLSWSADYVAVLSDEDRMSLDGNITAVNRTGLAYPDARLQLVAGVVRRAGPPELLVAQRALAVEQEGAQMIPAPDIGREALGEYHLYTVDEPVTLPDEATTQVKLLRAPGVPVERDLVLESPGFHYQGQHPELPPEHPEIRIAFVNDRASGLGEPLPGGILHAYREDERGELQFVGDGSVPHTPTGERVRIAIGQAFDVTARRTQTDWRRIDERSEESAWRIEIRNGGDRSRAVRVVERFPGDWTILEESEPHERVDVRTAHWTIGVPADGRAELTYRVRVTY